MRKIDIALTKAINERQPLKRQNVIYDPTAGTVTLHHNLIAKGVFIGTAKPPVCCFAGWLTPATRDRINAIRQIFGLLRISIAKEHAPNPLEWF
jgi:hypothetical protein